MGPVGVCSANNSYLYDATIRTNLELSQSVVTPLPFDLIELIKLGGETLAIQSSVTNRNRKRTSKIVPDRYCESFTAKIQVVF
jgi:hypothetical protein